MPGAGSIPTGSPSYIPPIDITPIATSSAAANQSVTAIQNSPFSVGGGGASSINLIVVAAVAVAALLIGRR